VQHQLGQKTQLVGSAKPGFRRARKSQKRGSRKTATKSAKSNALTMDQVPMVSKTKNIAIKQPNDNDFSHYLVLK